MAGSDPRRSNVAVADAIPDSAGFFASQTLASSTFPLCSNYAPAMLPLEEIALCQILYDRHFSLSCLQSLSPPFSEGISVDGRCFCTTSPASIMVTFEKVERSPEGKTPLGLFHSLTSHGCPAPISWALFRARLLERNDLFSPAWFPVQSL